MEPQILQSNFSSASLSRSLSLYGLSGKPGKLLMFLCISVYSVAASALS